MKPGVTVIVPMHNRASLISGTLESLASALHPGVSLQIIVIDDMSTDLGPALVENRFPSVTLIRNEVNKGASACRNQGLQIAPGEYTLFLDSDDLIEPNFFRPKIELLQREPDCLGVYGPWDYFESERQFNEALIRPRHSVYPLYAAVEHQSIVTNLLGGWFIPINATLWRTEAVKAIGGFDSRLSINQDVDFVFRMLLRGPIFGVKSPRALIRIHEGESVGRINSEFKLRQILDLRRRFLSELEEQGVVGDSALEAIARYAFSLWSTYRNEHPQTANELLQFSRSVYPGLRLHGTLLLRLLASLVGNENAIRVKQLLRR